MDHLPLGRSYLVVVPSYDMPCALILLTGLYGCDIDINPSSMYFISHRIHAIRDVATPSINIHAYWDQSSRRKYIPTLIGIFYMLIWHPQYTMIRSANHFFLSLSRFFFFFVCVLSLRSSYNHYTGNFPVNTRACSDLRCLKYFLSTVQGSFIDSCACAMFKTLETPTRMFAWCGIRPIV